MRIGFFTDTYLPVSNGICYVIDIMKNDLEAAGHEVFIFAPQNFRTKLPPEKNVIRLKALQGLFYSDQFTSFFWVPKQVKKIEAMDLDVIVLFTPSMIGALGAHAALKLGIPYVIQYGTDMEAYGDRYRLTSIAGLVVSMIIGPYLLRLGSARTLDFYKDVFRPEKISPNESYFSYAARLVVMQLHERADAIIATSKKTAAQLKKWPIEQNIKVIPTGVNALPVHRKLSENFMKRFKLKKEHQIILYAGRLSVEKNLECLIDAFSLLAKKNPKARLLLVGDFQHRQHLEAHAAKAAPKKIIFTGLIDRNLLGSVYPLAKVFAFTSLTDCQALVLNEAAHAGLPLVWCDTPTLNPVLKDGQTGLRARPTKEDIAEKIEELLSDEKKRKDYGRQARLTARQYKEAAQSAKLEALLKKTAAR